jgi:hypothetical protein
MAFPINTASGNQEPQPSIVFEKGVGLEPVYIVAPHKFKPKPKPPVRVVKIAPARYGTEAPLGFNPCNCWSYVVFKRGGNMPLGYGAAKNYPVSSKTPQIGAIIITYESNSGHMGIVVGIEENYVIIDDYNYKKCGHTIRKLPINSSLTKGYIP